MPISTDTTHGIERHSPSSTPADLFSTTQPSNSNPEGCFSPPFAAPMPMRAGSTSISVEVKSDKIPAVVAVRELEMPRTPSPTLSEAQVLAEKPRMCGNWRRLVNMQRYRENPRALLPVLAGVLVLAFLAAFLVEQKNIENALRPAAIYLRDLPEGWLIPIAVMFVISFPPLFGHEIVAILVGDVWGVGIGFGIVAAGTLLGELGNFIAFKWWCMQRGRKFEEKSITYALYSQIIREGGYRVPIIMRFSAIPGHLTTAVFATCGMSVWMFLVSATISLPKQLAAVYIGDSTMADGSTTKTGTAVKVVVILITVTITSVALRYIHRKMEEVKVRVVYNRRKARQAKIIAAADISPTASLRKSTSNATSGPSTLAKSPIERTSPGQSIHTEAESTYGTDTHIISDHTYGDAEPNLGPTASMRSPFSRRMHDGRLVGESGISPPGRAYISASRVPFEDIELEEGTGVGGKFVAR